MRLLVVEGVVVVSLVQVGCSRLVLGDGEAEALVFCLEDLEWR
jgi:hypothetical protein